MAVKPLRSFLALTVASCTLLACGSKRPAGIADVAGTAGHAGTAGEGATGGSGVPVGEAGSAADASEARSGTGGAPASEGGVVGGEPAAAGRSGGGNAGTAGAQGAAAGTTGGPAADAGANSGSDGGGAGDPFLGDVMPTKNGDLWRFTFGEVVFEVNAARGASVLTFARGGHNVLADGCHFRPSPQKTWNWPPPAEIAQGAYSASQAGVVVTMESQTNAQWHVKAKKRFWAIPPTTW